MINLCYDIPAHIQRRFANMYQHPYQHPYQHTYQHTYPNVVDLELGDGFNSRVGLLPEKLIRLKFGISFNQPVENLPNNLKILIFGYKFNQPIDSVPDTLEYLTIHNSYRYKLPLKLIKKIKNKELIVTYLDSYSSTCESSLILY
jgi:hypothetical protein